MSKKDLDLFFEFIDQYQAYKANYITKSGLDDMANWEGLTTGIHDLKEALDYGNFGIDDSAVSWIEQYNNYLIFKRSHA
jgi:hypothetical protein